MSGAQKLLSFSHLGQEIGFDQSCKLFISFILVTYRNLLFEKVEKSFSKLGRVQKKTAIITLHILDVFDHRQNKNGHNIQLID